MARHGIPVVAILLGLILNVWYFGTHDADWRARCSWGSLALFSMAVVAEWGFSGLAPVWTGHHLWGFGCSCCSSLAGRWAGRFG
jgi:hypothetical protein